MRRPGVTLGRLRDEGLEMAELLLRDGMLPDERRVDVLLSGDMIAAVLPADRGRAAIGADTVDLEGRLLLPALSEPHAHIDKAFTADAFPNPAGDLDGAIEAILAGWEATSVDDIVARASNAVRRLVASGTTAVRTHIDVSSAIVAMSTSALGEVKRRFTGVCDLQLVGMGWPVTGDEGATGRRSLDKAIEAGIDLIGGAPHLEDDPKEAIAFALDTAAAHGMAVDLHLDEVLDVSVQNLSELARQTEARGLGGRVTASHCVSHGLLSPQQQREVGRALADAGVSIVTLPRTNLYLQSRQIEEATPRGMPGVRALLDSGVIVAAGADNVQDPFYVIGRSDPLETASLLITAAHLRVDESFELVTTAPRRVMGLDPVRVEPGNPAELVAVRATSVRQAIAEQPADRIVLHRGRVVARTTVDEWLAVQ